MAEQIIDGTGKGFRAQVDEFNRLSTNCVTQSRIADRSKRSGDGFILATGFISLTTTGSFSGAAYVKNTSETKDLFIKSIRTCGDGTGSIKIKILANPTTGTLISNANAGHANSSNLGVSTTFEGLYYVASGDGKTVTDGTHVAQFINKMVGHSVQDYEGAIVVPNGKSFAIVMQPSVATDVCVEIQCWFE